jgi:hypothetical protein
MKIILLVIALIFLSSMGASAHSIDTFFVFPQFADGVLSDGSSYRSTLMIQPAFSSNSMTCNLTLRGMTTSFGSSGISSSFSISIPAGGWTQIRTNGTQAFHSGYATLTCSTFVNAQVLYTLYERGIKASEATVFPSNPSFIFKLLADETEGARLGLAVANDTDLSRAYQITLLTSGGSTYAKRTVNVGARQSVAKFLDELIPAAANQILQVQVQASDFSNFPSLA